MKQRIFSAIVVLAIFIPILIIGGVLFKLFVLIVALLGLKELLDIKEKKDVIPLTMKILTFGLFTYLVISMSDTNNLFYLLDYRSISLILLILSLPIIIYNDNKVYNINDAMFLVGAIFFLGISFNLFILLREYSLVYIIYLFVITTMTDTYAYIAGNLIGHHKLIEKISPNKTWEGVIIGTVFGVLISSVFYYIAISDDINVFYLVLSTTLLSLIGQFGDLVFSSIKRLYNKKDFSNIMPGHGGVLDRLDSFIFVALGYVLLMFII
jgi:phosphatidate cytidylyltransferase